MTVNEIRRLKERIAADLDQLLDEGGIAEGEDELREAADKVKDLLDSTYIYSRDND